MFTGNSISIEVYQLPNVEIGKAIFTGEELAASMISYLRAIAFRCPEGEEIDRRKDELVEHFKSKRRTEAYKTSLGDPLSLPTPRFPPTTSLA